MYNDLLVGQQRHALHVYIYIPHQSRHYARERNLDKFAKPLNYLFILYTTPSHIPRPTPRPSHGPRTQRQRKNHHLSSRPKREISWGSPPSRVRKANLQGMRVKKSMLTYKVCGIGEYLVMGFDVLLDLMRVARGIALGTRY